MNGYLHLVRRFWFFGDIFVYIFSTTQSFSHPPTTMNESNEIVTWHTKLIHAEQELIKNQIIIKTKE